MMRSLAVVAGGVSLLCAASAVAQEVEYTKFFGSGSYQLTFDSSDREGNDEGHGVHFSLGYFLTRHFAVEAAADYSWFSGSEAGDRDSEARAIKFGGLFAFSRNAQFEPYFGLGAGLANNKFKDPSDTRRRAFGEATLGVMAPIGDWWGIRGEVAYRYTDGIPRQVAGTARNSANEAMLRVGLMFPLAKQTAGVTVPEPQPRRVRDSDGDGVPDHLDECPDTPPGVRVDARGCPLDSDGDGVPDYLDECPGTPAGVQVDERGCPVTTEIERKFEDVNFGFDQDQLTSYAQSTLDRTAQELRELIQKDPGLRVSVEGHTDSIGPAEYNVGLGERRARSVRDYLAGKGIERERMDISSGGETRPIASNDTAKGRLLNRRVEIRAKGSR